MDSATLADLLAKIRLAVARAGYADRAAWLQTREHALRSNDADAESAARIELSRVVLGMGGLIDMAYGPPAEQKRVDALIDELWTAVKP